MHCVCEVRTGHRAELMKSVVPHQCSFPIRPAQFMLYTIGHPGFPKPLFIWIQAIRAIWKTEMHLEVNHCETHAQHQTQWELTILHWLCKQNNPKPCTPTWGQAVTDQTVLSLANTVEAKLQISHGISDVYIERKQGGEKSISEWWSLPHYVLAWWYSDVIGLHVLSGSGLVQTSVQSWTCLALCAITLRQCPQLRCLHGSCYQNKVRLGRTHHSSKQCGGDN